ncbi:Fur family transcriptional regulator [Curvivirga sp.]|uniref:Fur family transcriptional regulator n=1 Tax=Curvivirga sp. TaxID=2856848 RepID=UPI003B5C836B
MSAKPIKLTTDRKSVLDILKSSDSPKGAYDILDELKKVKSNAVPMTVYRALDYLTEHGLVHKVENLNAYILCNHPEHHHICQIIICEACNKATESCDKELASLVQKKAEDAGFKISKAILEITATCEECLANDKGNVAL